MTSQEVNPTMMCIKEPAWNTCIACMMRTVYKSRSVDPSQFSELVSTLHVSNL